MGEAAVDGGDRAPLGWLRRECWGEREEPERGEMQGVSWRSWRPPAAAAASPVPEDILEHRVVQRGGTSTSQVRVRWTDQPLELATWEIVTELQHHFPNAPAWG